MFRGRPCLERASRQRIPQPAWRIGHDLHELLDQEHARDTTTFFGVQVCYLAHSAHGYLGALGFSAWALRRAAR